MFMPLVMAMGHAHVHRDGIQLAVAYSGFGGNGIGEASDCFRWPLENGNFHAVLVVKMNVQG